jgi:agmatinase
LWPPRSFSPEAGRELQTSVPKSTRLPDFASAEATYDASPVVILPVPFERSTSWGKGTEDGPRAILCASQYLEHYDEELDAEPCSSGIATLPSVRPTAADPALALQEIQVQAARHLHRGKFLVGLGGEHTISLPLVRAAGEYCGELGVVQFDAHADLRSEYEGTPYSHACVMRHLVDAGIPTLALGLRSLSSGEARLIRERQLPVIWGHQLNHAARLLPSLLDLLPEQIYLTFDVDFFDPSLLPATGTPEPGGGTWYPTLGLLRMLFERKRIVAMDLVELAPVPALPASDFVAAKLVYKCIGYRLATSSPGG